MYEHFFKRIIDIILSITAFILLAPLLLPVALCLLITGEHHIIYLQERIGYKNCRFKIWKFATMLKNSPNLGTGSLTVRSDPRILPIGKFLRKTKINELPQIVNVFIGSMSIVGPRPQMEIDFLKFSKEVQKNIYDSKPGITGVGSIIFRDEEKWISRCSGDKHEFYTKNIAPYKGQLELWYQSNMSFTTDVKIIFLTLWVILFSESALIFKLLDNLPEKPEHLD